MTKMITLNPRPSITQYGVAASTLSIAEALLRAKNLTQKLAARRRLNSLIAKRVADGCDLVKVVAGVKAAMTRIAKQKGLRQTSDAWMAMIHQADS